LGEGAVLQIIAKPAGSKLRKGFRRTLEALRRGQSAEDVFRGNTLAFKWRDISKAINPPSREEQGQERQQQQYNKQAIDEDAVKAVESKINKPLFLTNVRLLASAPTPFQADDLL